MYISNAGTKSYPLTKETRIHYLGKGKQELIVRGYVISLVKLKVLNIVIWFTVYSCIILNWLIRMSLFKILSVR
jgi:hypothetical protein